MKVIYFFLIGSLLSFQIKGSDNQFDFEDFCTQEIKRRCFGVMKECYTEYALPLPIQAAHLLIPYGQDMVIEGAIGLGHLRGFKYLSQPVFKKVSFITWEDVLRTVFAGGLALITDEVPGVQKNDIDTTSWDYKPTPFTIKLLKGMYASLRLVITHKMARGATQVADKYGMHLSSREQVVLRFAFLTLWDATLGYYLSPYENSHWKRLEENY